MTKQLVRIWALINKGLTLINLFLLAILTGGGWFVSKENKPVAIPLWANVLLLAVLVSILSLYIIRATKLREGIFS
jgi:hypothetical protein